jgi:hypothetical protein
MYVRNTVHEPVIAKVATVRILDLISAKYDADNDEVHFFNLPNPFNLTMALASTQPLT